MYHKVFLIKTRATRGLNPTPTPNLPYAKLRLCCDGQTDRQIDIHTDITIRGVWTNHTDITIRGVWTNRK